MTLKCQPKEQARRGSTGLGIDLRAEGRQLVADALEEQPMVDQLVLEFVAQLAFHTTRVVQLREPTCFERLWIRIGGGLQGRGSRASLTQRRALRRASQPSLAR